MDTLYVYNKKMRESYMLQAIFNKICSISKVSMEVRTISAYFKKNNILKNNAVLLLDKMGR